LSAIELSNANPSVATLYRLAAAYGTTVLELYDFPSRSSRVVHPNRPSRISAEKVFQNAHLPRLSNRSIPTRLEVLRISIASAGQMIGITPNPILELQRQLGIRAQVVPVNGRHFGRGKSGAAQIHFSQLFKRERQNNVIGVYIHRALPLLEGALVGSVAPLVQGHQTHSSFDGTLRELADHLRGDLVVAADNVILLVSSGQAARSRLA
jgi:transcriptional regulator with XRE-family HTH domain